MNPSSSKEAFRLFDRIKRVKPPRKLKVAVAPPFVYLESFSKKLAGSRIKLAAQDVFWESPPVGKGAYTGEISAAMLKNLKVSYVIVGHSERRFNLGETDEMVNKKIKTALKSGLKVVLCVGEREREADELPEIVKNQLRKALEKIPVKLAGNIIIAYEPIWALSTTKGGRADDPEDLFRIVIYIRRILFDIFGKRYAEKFPIIYGGSVDDLNAEKFLRVEGISGALVGGASLDHRKFTGIIQKAGRL